MKSHIKPLGFLLLGLTLLSGCAETKNTTVDLPGRKTHYVSKDQVAPIKGVGADFRDVTSMTDRMVRDMLATPEIAARVKPAKVIIDSEYFTNQSTNRLDKDMITMKLKSQLRRSARGRIRFVSRDRINMVEKERNLKRQGIVDTANNRLAKKTFGADYRLAGRIMTMDQVAASSGTQVRASVFYFEMIDLETGETIWDNTYEFEKVSQDDVIYR